MYVRINYLMPNDGIEFMMTAGTTRLLLTELPAWLAARRGCMIIGIYPRIYPL